MSSRYSTLGNGAHQRDLRTQLFTPLVKPPSRTASPYDKVASPLAKHQESYLLLLESQNNDEMDSMGQKVAMLKNLGVKMGTEINKSIKLNDEITNGFEKGKVTLKNTYNKMVVMSQRAGITWRMWLVVFLLVFLWFFWVWLT
ncbi:uncharacterized protein CANTADRAFT_141286 [Suhomyces tanzawaensis NRRL Y-17324]|uniref:t-SNARE coiled-coil homology domain-containing protein n=1 Tax=Suhomyces tanzawaensis NRRL Y-17324 TaxID=984487 RepID=A0A1E4SS62_9ASCO|nr:uncharacterized protein CANTADRAFT_141286 [Suhomyces tanzawaensis NRRL Y-17324]ODV82353.1 hypothetical protein CANTADRAFT_141286 [Suhomyces tanzawaensis NRRL Y-17324]